MIKAVQSVLDENRQQGVIKRMYKKVPDYLVNQGLFIVCLCYRRELLQFSEIRPP